MSAAKIANLPHGGDRRSDQAANLPIDNAVSQSEAADLLNVSRRSLRSASQVIDQGTPELDAAVFSGDIAVSTAATIAQAEPAE
jgi:hypothetical protein